MKVFVTGATGVLGRRAVAQLLASGAEVTGVARTRQKGVELHGLGATPVQVSPFDRDALSAAVAGHQVVCNLATAVPAGEQTGRRSAWNDNHGIRREGARNLVDAALHAGADRYIQESISFPYADGGDGYLDESAGVDPSWITEPALVASAVVAALRAPSCVYNVADDRPLRRAEHAEVLAEALGAGPLSLPAGSAGLPRIYP